MAKINYPPSSPYYETSQLNWRLEPFVSRKILPNINDASRIITTQYHNRPQYFSNDIYGVPSYWWVFMERNIDVIRDPIWDFVSGLEIMVPSLGYLKSLGL